MLGNLQWIFNEPSVSEPLLRKTLPEAFDLNTQDVLAADTERFNEPHNFSDLCTGQNGQRVTGVYEDVYHSNRGVDDDTEDEPYLLPEPGDETKEDWGKTLEKAIIISLTFGENRARHWSTRAERRISTSKQP